MTASPFDSFDAIFGLSTDRRDAQRSAATAALRSVGAADRLRWFDGSVVDRRFAGRPRDRLGWQRLAGASHREVWKIARQEGRRNVLVFEDDVAFPGWRPDAFQSALATLATLDWQLFYLGFNLYGKPLAPRRLGPHLVSLARGTDLRSTHAYALNGPALDRAVRFRPFFDPVVDQWLPQQFAMHCLVPLMSVQAQEIPGGTKEAQFQRNYRKLVATG